MWKEIIKYLFYSWLGFFFIGLHIETKQILCLLLVYVLILPGECVQLQWVCLTKDECECFCFTRGYDWCSLPWCWSWLIYRFPRQRHNMLHMIAACSPGEWMFPQLNLWAVMISPYKEDTWSSLYGDLPFKLLRDYGKLVMRRTTFCGFHFRWCHRLGCCEGIIAGQRGKCNTSCTFFFIIKVFISTTAFSSFCVHFEI